MQAFLTTEDGSRIFAPTGALFLSKRTSVIGETLIHIDARRRFQTVDGFGIVLTGASVHVLSRLPDHANALMRELFGIGPHDIGLSFVRVAIGASDLSVGNYSYDDLPTGASDPDMRAFTLERDSALIADLRQIHVISPEVQFMATPWTAPSWMKSSGNLNGGALLPSAYAAYGRYLVTYVRALHENGIDLAALSLQNEPRVDALGYPSMTLSSDAAAILVKSTLGPQLRATFPRVRLLVGDANWDERFPLEVLADPDAARYITGAAFHCYSGAVSQMAAVARAYPRQTVVMDECSGGAWSSAFRDNLAWDMTNLIIGATVNWSRAVILGSLALDESSGPTNGGCLNCRGVVTVHNDGSVTRNVEYAVLAHIAKYVRPGAIRIMSTLVRGSSVPNVAFHNRDGSTVLIVFNGSRAPTRLAVTIRSSSFGYELPAGAAATFVWP